MPETNRNEVTVAEDIRKPEASVTKQDIPKKYSSREQAGNTKIFIEEIKLQLVEDSQREKAVEDLQRGEAVEAPQEGKADEDPQPQKTRPDAKIRRCRTPTRTSDLVTLLACTKEFIGDAEYPSDQD